MNIDNIKNELLKEIVSENILIDEPMKNHTSFKIGGPVEIMVKPQNIDELYHVIKVAKIYDVNYNLMGNGSNILVEDRGIKGIVVKIAEGFDSVEIKKKENDEFEVVVDAGILLSRLSRKIAQESLGGFEFASGIPGTVGGAVFMNAGAYGGEMKDVVKWVEVIDKDGIGRKINCADMEFGYRTSKIRRENLIVVKVALSLKSGEIETIKKYTDELTEKRVSKQPLDMPSAGSTFKRPEGNFAGKLIDDSGLRGLRHKGAMVSSKHCGFIVNTGNATCKDVLELIETVQKTVLDKYEVELEREVRIFGKE